MSHDFFSRPMVQCARDSRVLIDSELPDTGYVDTFGFEWTQIDGFMGKEVMSHGHIFGRFQLPANYFKGKVVVDVGCGNGRIGRLVAPHAKHYLGLDLSEAVYSFPSYLRASNIQLCRANGTDLPLRDSLSDVTICWGVLHHMDKPVDALRELARITKPEGEVILFIYSDAYAARENFNRLVKHVPDELKHELVAKTSDFSDAWREVDKFYANILSQGIFMSVKESREWQIFQWYDGVTPRYHHQLENDLPDVLTLVGLKVKQKMSAPGCYILRAYG